MFFILICAKSYLLSETFGKIICSLLQTLEVHLPIFKIKITGKKKPASVKTGFYFSELTIEAAKLKNFKKL